MSSLFAINSHNWQTKRTDHVELARPCSYVIIYFPSINHNIVPVVPKIIIMLYFIGVWYQLAPILFWDCPLIDCKHR